MLLARIDENQVALQRSIQLCGLAGALSIRIASCTAGVAMRTTRRLASHFQQTCQRASVTETAAQWVHDPRKPLAAVRANVKALLLSSDKSKETDGELHRDISALNDEISAFPEWTTEH